MANKKTKLTKRQWTISFNQLVVFVGVFAVVAGVAIVKSFAAPGSKGGGGGSSSLSVVMVTDANADGLPDYSDTITFRVSTTVTDRPYVQLNCTQNGKIVYQQQAGFYPGYPWSQNYVLSSNYWTSGAASCSAYLQYNSGKRTLTLTTLNFQVNP